jgi:acyl-CoA synthetase (AMP-forming)/AMP-acid ligase II
MKQTLSGLFYDAAEKNGDRQAIWCDGQSETYARFSARVSRYVRFLRDNGADRLQNIGIPMKNSIESVALILAAAHMGAGLVPINPTLPADAIRLAFELGNVKHIIAPRLFLKKYLPLEGGSLSGAVICTDGETEGAVPLSDADSLPDSPPPPADITGDETLILTMTSGSTGTPKPIDLTQNDKYRRATAHISLYGITPRDRVLAATPLYHSLAERLALMPLLIGGTSVLLSRFTPSLWLNCIKEQGVTFTIAVSAQLSQVAELLDSPFIPQMDSLRCVVSSSALLESHVRSELITKLRCDFHEMYGTSETSTVTDIDFKDAPEKKRSVGRPLPEAEIRIARDDGTQCAPGEIGEITCKTTLMCSGYRGAPDAWARAMDDGFFKTGDLGYLDEDGYLYFSGRKKELIITGGINVYPQDVERCVRQLPAVGECAAFAYPDERLGEVVAVAIVPKPGETLTRRAVQVQCANNLADFQQPHRIFFVEELPKNAMGKLMKSKIVEYVRLRCAQDA